MAKSYRNKTGVELPQPKGMGAARDNSRGGGRAAMSKNENDDYRHMSEQEARRWLTASCVAAAAFTVALFVIATNNLGRGWSPAVTQSAEVSNSAEAALARAGE
jgi:hypothetical protein